MPTPLLVAVLAGPILSLFAGCALLDGLGGDSGGPFTDNPGPGQCNPDFSGCPGDECGSEIDLGSIPVSRDFNTCNFDIGPDFGLGFCAPNSEPGFDMVFRFSAADGQVVELCTSSGLNAIMMHSDRCELTPFGECLPINGNCVTLGSTSTSHFLYWVRAREQNEDACGVIHIEARAAGL